MDGALETGENVQSTAVELLDMVAPGGSRNDAWRECPDPACSHSTECAGRSEKEHTAKVLEMNCSIPLRAAAWQGRSLGRGPRSFPCAAAVAGAEERRPALLSGNAAK